MERVALETRFSCGEEGRADGSGENMGLAVLGLLCEWDCAGQEVRCGEWDASWGGEGMHCGMGMQLWDREGMHLMHDQSSAVCQHEQHFTPAPCHALMLGTTEQNWRI